MKRIFSQIERKFVYAFVNICRDFGYNMMKALINLNSLHSIDLRRLKTQTQTQTHKSISRLCRKINKI
jgi:hypothetical protein